MLASIPELGDAITLCRLRGRELDSVTREVSEGESVLASIPELGDAITLCRLRRRELDSVTGEVSEGESVLVNISPPLNWEGKAENGDHLDLTLDRHTMQAEIEVPFSLS